MPIIFDIETGPLPLPDLQRICDPYEADAKLIEACLPFDPAAIRFGNMKDPAKINAKIIEMQERHAAAKAEAEAKLATGEADYWAEQTEKAPLSALTGRVVAIGILNSEVDRCAIVATGPNKSEADVLRWFWGALEKAQTTWIGHNIHDFDLPFLVQRSRIVGLTVPGNLRSGYGGRWADRFIDTMVEWCCGRYGQKAGLDRISKACGGPGKSGNGADFWRLWESADEAEHNQAEAYLVGDLRLTLDLAQRLGVA